MKKTLFYGTMAMGALCVSMLSSCKEDVVINDVSSEIQLDMGIGVPIGQATATMADFLPTNGDDYYLGAEDDGTVFLELVAQTHDVYREGLDFAGVYTPTTNPISIPLMLLGSSPLPAGMWTSPMPISIPLGSVNMSADYRIDSGRVAGVKIELDLSATTGMTLSSSNINGVYLTFPQMKDLNGNSTFMMTNTGGLAYELDLQEVSLTLNGGNSLQVTIGIDVASPITFVSTGMLSLYAQLTLNDFIVLWGNIEPDATIGWKSGSVDLTDLYNLSTIKGMNLPFKNPQIIAKASSNVGVPLIFKMKDVAAVSDAGNTHTATFSGNNECAYTLTNWAHTPGEIYSDSVTFANNVTTGGHYIQASTDQLFTFGRTELPTVINYKYDIAVNHAETSPHFVVTDPYFDVDFRVKLPMDLNSGLYVNYKDTAEIDDADVQTYIADYIDYAYVQIKGINALPVQVYAKLKYLDAAQQEIHFNASADSIAIAGAKVNANGVVDKAALKAFDPIKIILSDNAGTNELAQLKQLKYVVFDLTMEAPKAGDQVHLYKTDYIKLNASLVTHGHGNVDLDTIF